MTDIGASPVRPKLPPTHVESEDCVVGPEGDECEEAGFTEWVRPHLGVLTGIAVREVGAAHAEDVVQETLARAWARRHTYRADAGSARGWLIAILLDRARRFRVRTLRPAPRPDRRWPASDGAVDDRLRVENAVRQLPQRQRQVVTLFYLADLPVSAIAAALGISPAAVRVQLHAARATLRHTLEAP